MSTIKKYLIYIDILGFENLPNSLSKTTQLDPDYLRENCLIKPLRDKIYEICDNLEISVFTDNFLIVTSEINKVFNIVKEITKLTIPLLNPMNIPFEIAIGTKMLDTNYTPEYQGKTIEFLKTDLLNVYKKYYKEKYKESIKETFILLTSEFYNELSKDRKYLCEKYSYSEKEFYLGNVQMIRDIDGIVTNDIIQIKKFNDKIQKKLIWGYFEIKYCLIKDYNSDRWLFYFVYIKLLENNINQRQEIRTDHFILLHRIYGIENFNEILNKFMNMEFNLELAGITASMELIKEKMRYDFHSYIAGKRVDGTAADFGIDKPSYAIVKGSNQHFEREIRHKIEEELRNSERPFDSLDPIKDAIISGLNLNFWTLSMDPFLAIFAPIPIEFPRITLTDQINIDIQCSSDSINPDSLSATVHNNEFNLHKRIHDFTRINSNHISSSTLSDQEVDSLLVNVYYYQDKLDDQTIVKS